MAKPLRGECDVELGGEKFTLRLGIGELEELDNITGMGTLALAQALSGPGAKITQARAVLAQALRIDGKRASPSRIGQIMERAGFFEVCAACAQVLTLVLADPDPGNAAAPAGTTGQTPTGG